jgi:hypothetical protein
MESVSLSGAELGQRRLPTVFDQLELAKTKLVPRIIDHFTNRPPDHALSYFCCNRNKDARRDPENILCRFVKQLSISPAGNAIQQSLAVLRSSSNVVRNLVKSGADVNA